MENKDSYSVSLFYFKKNTYNTETILNVMLVKNANSEEEALGIAITYFDKENKGFQLSNKVVLKIE